MRLLCVEEGNCWHSATHDVENVATVAIWVFFFTLTKLIALVDFKQRHKYLHASVNLGLRHIQTRKILQYASVKIGPMHKILSASIKSILEA